MKNTILKWFDILNLPQEWRTAVAEAAENFDPSTLDSREEPYRWLSEQEDKMLCMLYSLFKCEDFFETAKKRNIPEDILLASLSEIRRYAIEYNTMTKGEKLGILQIKWIGKILSGNIYRLGRLEFEMRGSLHSSEKHGISVGDSILAVHIPDNGGPFNEETCKAAYALAEEFFAKYFPEYEYKYYTCHSWMLDNTLKLFLKPSSNIVKFMDSFDIADSEESYTALIYLFGRGTTAEDLKNITPSTSLQKSVIEHINNGGKLYQSFGVKPRYSLPDENITEKTILKWFEILNYPTEWKDSVTQAVKNFDLAAIETQEKPYHWLYDQENKMLCLLYALYKCESFYENGKKLGIPHDILIETLQEVRRHACNYNKATNGEKIGIFQIRWLGNILNGNIYCLGRLEFEMATTKRTWERHNIVPGDKVLNVHIPGSGKPLDEEEFKKSFEMSVGFFKKYFPEFEYKCYACHSWLLDPTLKKLLKPTSNILKFMDNFDIIETKESDSGIRIAFGTGTTYENIHERLPKTSLQKAVLEHVSRGGKLYEGYGFMEKI